MNILTDELDIQINSFYIKMLDKTFIDLYISSEEVVTIMTDSWFGELSLDEIRYGQQDLILKLLKKHNKRLKKFMGR